MSERSKREAIERIVRIFDELVSYEAAERLFEKLGDEKWHFISVRF